MMKKIALSLFALLCSIGVAHATCPVGVAASSLCNQLTAVNPQLTDTLWAWQYGQTPGARQMSVQQVLGLLSQTQIETALGFTPVSKAGDSMTGPLVLSGDPVGPLGAATKQYVDGSGVSTAACAACAGTGTTDDTAALNAFIAVNAGTTIKLAANKCYAILSGNLVIPDNTALVSLSGVLRGVLQGGNPSCNGSLLVNPSFTVIAGNSSTLGFSEYRATLVSNPTVSQVQASVAQWWNEASAGVTIPANISGVTFLNMFIEGFHTGIQARSGMFKVIGTIDSDNTTALALFGGGDNTYINTIRAEPFYGGLLGSTTGAWQRYGAATFLGFAPTGWHLDHVQSEGWPLGLVTVGAGGGTANDVEYEYPASWAPGTGGFPAEQDGVCIHVTSGTTGALIRDPMCGNGASNGVFADGIVIDDNPNSVQIRDAAISTIPSTGTGIYGSGGTAVPTTITIAGTPVAGTSSVSATISGASVAGGPYTISYTAQAGDTTTSIAEYLTYLIDTQRSELAHSHVTASDAALSNIVTVFWPADASVSVSALGAGGLTATTGSGSADPGSSALVVGADLSASNVGPLITLGNTASGALSWSLDGLYTGNGTTALPTGWLAAPTMPKSLYLKGIQWSPVSNTNLSAGTVGSNSFDDQGTALEGSASTGFVLTFATPWVAAPKCPVTPLNAAAVTAISSGTFSVTATTTTLTVAHASATGALFSYVCRMQSHT